LIDMTTVVQIPLIGAVLSRGELDGLEELAARYNQEVADVGPVPAGARGEKGSERVDPEP
jgi:hypothetical protein